MNHPAKAQSLAAPASWPSAGNRLDRRGQVSDDSPWQSDNSSRRSAAGSTLTVRYGEETRDQHAERKYSQLRSISSI